MLSALGGALDQVGREREELETMGGQKSANRRRRERK